MSESNPFVDHSVLIITESLITDESYQLPAFYSFVQPAEQATMGNGICIFAKPELDPVLVSKSEHHVAIRCKGVDILGFYFKPQTPVEHITLEVAAALSSVDPRQPLTILAGDFNARIDEGDRGATLCSVLREEFLLELWNKEDEKTFIAPTGQSTIDLVFSQKEPTSLRTVQTVYRRHCQVISEWDLSLEPVEAVPLRLKREINVEALLGAKSLTHVSDLLNAGALTSGFDMLSQSIQAGAREIRTRSSSHQPWFDRTCARAKRRVLNNMNQDCYWNLRKEYKRLCRHKRREFEENALLRRIERTEVKPWELFKKRAQRNIAPVSLDSWNTHFSELLNPDNAPASFTALAEPDDNEALVPGWCENPFTVSEVSNRIQQLSDNKAPGFDRIANEHLKKSAPWTLDIWVLLMNACLWFTCLPSQWRTAKLISLFKGKGSPSDPSNYRGIALMNTSMKLLTGLINQRLMPAISDLLPSEQYGFRPTRGTKEAVDKLISFTKRAIQQPKGKAYCCFVDFYKAFDSCDRKILIDKLKNQFGVRGKILLLIGNILSTNFVRVFDGLRTTSPIIQNRGVLQGDSLSPSLFLCYISDLADSLRAIADLDFLFYADDLAFFSEDSTAIQAGLHALQRWCAANKMRVNTTKTKIMKFRKAGRLGSFDHFTYQGGEIEVTNTYDYLGITLTPSLSFTKHLEKRRAKATLAIGSLTHLSMTSVATALKIFNMKIKPILTYGLESISNFLSLAHLKSIDSVKTIFLKRALRISKFSSATLSLHLCNTRGLSLELRDQGFVFEEQQWSQYLDWREEREAAFHDNNYLDGPAFHDTSWMRSNQKHRHVITRTTAHGFHHLLCCNTQFHECDPLSCCCRFCHEGMTRFHLLQCRRFDGGLRQKYAQLMALEDVT